MGGNVNDIDYNIPTTDPNVEGNISWFSDRVAKLRELILTCQPKTIVEIGFNAGHSCKLILDTLLKNPTHTSKHIYVFDICQHEYVESNFKALKEEYCKCNITMTLVRGSTKNTLNSYLDNIDQIDFVNIDGDHSPAGVTSDFNNVKDKISKGGIVYVDDYKSNHPVFGPLFEKLSQAVDLLDWASFETDWIPGVIWGIKK
jgi:predicted O-methyltransferase YrrM